MNTYADLLRIAEEAELITDGPAGTTIAGTATATAAAVPGEDQAAGQTITGGPRIEIIEADDDPHRLARVNLERYATKNAGRTIRYWRDEWYLWKNNTYSKITEREFRAKLSLSIREEFVRCNIAAQESMTGDGAGPGDVRKVTQAIVSNVMQATSGMVVVSGDTELNTWLPTGDRRHCISMANGLVDIDAVLEDRDDFLSPNSPEWFSMVSLPYEFDPTATCPRFDKFLEHNLEMDPERIKILQEWAGYLLLSDASEQKFMVLEGEGANGKSVYIAALTAMLGRNNVSTVPLEKFGDRFALTTTLGKLLNAAGDCGDLDKTAEGELKSFTSGDRMYFDRKGVSPIDCTPTARFMMSCNNRPRFSDRSQGVWRRMLLIPWRVEIGPAMRVRGMDTADWWQASGELPGIFRWALVGLARLRQQRGFSESEIMSDALAEYQEEMNPAKVFIQNHFEEKANSIIKSFDVYRFYKRWAEENGYRPLAERTFGKEIRRTIKSVQRIRIGSRGERHWAYAGLAYSQDEICGVTTKEPGLF